MKRFLVLCGWGCSVMAFFISALETSLGARGVSSWHSVHFILMDFTPSSSDPWQCVQVFASSGVFICFIEQLKSIIPHAMAPIAMVLMNLLLKIIDHRPPEGIHGTCCILVLTPWSRWLNHHHGIWNPCMLYKLVRCSSRACDDNSPHNLPNE